jgi:hypothetical protein
MRSLYAGRVDCFVDMQGALSASFPFVDSGFFKCADVEKSISGYRNSTLRHQTKSRLADMPSREHAEATILSTFERIMNWQTCGKSLMVTFQG